MFPEGNVWSTFMFLLLLSTRVHAEKICSVLSEQEVHMGSDFQIYCIFKKVCNWLIYQDEMPLNYSKRNSTVVMMNIVNLTRTTTLTCKCHDVPEPCGTDIVPGYPPAVPQNLTCIQEGEFGKVNCTWKTGRETHVKTTSDLWIRGAPPVCYASVAMHDKTRSAAFPVSGIQSDFSVWVHTKNNLGSANSTVLSFSLNEIVKPSSPKILKVECSSRHCQLFPDNAQNIQLIEIRYEEKPEGLKRPSFNKPCFSTSWNITSLNPYSTYIFEIRWKLGPARGLWSEWTRIEGTTDEEAPAAMLDAWYIAPTPADKKLWQLFWRELNKSESRGKILEYIVTDIEQGNKTTVPGNKVTLYCFSCNVSIAALNSKGLSPARPLRLQTIDELSYKVSHTAVNNHSIALFWPWPVSTSPVTEFLVEWYPVGLKGQLQWTRVERHLNTAYITGLKPAECYTGSVIYLYSSETKKANFNRISTWQTGSPVPIIDDTNERLVVKWSEISPKNRGGCLENYTIYLKDSADKIQKFSVLHPQREYHLSNLILGQKYKLWVTAWTTAGESPHENERLFKTNHSREILDENSMALLISLGSVVFLTCLCFLCLCQFSSIHRRLSECCHCLMPSIVPDPANSKWAKECAREKGEMNLHLHLSDSSMSEEEPNTVEVEELPEDEAINNEETFHPVTLKVESAPYQHNITSSYLKSFSNESSGSDATQASRNTDITVDYISTHEVISGGEEDDDDNDEEHEPFEFFPCPKSSFLEPLISIGGKLTLDSVKIDCSDFLDCA